MKLTEREKNLKAVVLEVLKMEDATKEDIIKVCAILEVLKVNDANDYEIVRVCQEILDEKT